MDSSALVPPSFLAQTNALMRKNLIFQKRNRKSTLRLVVFPIYLCVLLAVLQTTINKQLNKPKYRCGCKCVDANGDGSCQNVCGIQYSTPDQADSCAIPSPPEWPALLQVPRPEYRAARAASGDPRDLPNESCREARSCPASILFTGKNESLSGSLASNLFASSPLSNLSDYLSTLSDLIAGTDTPTRYTEFVEPAFFSGRPVYFVQPQCRQNISLTVPVSASSVTLMQELKCVQGLPLWRNSSFEINDELFKGYRQGNTERMINEFTAAYDFLNSNLTNFNVIVWYNSTYKNATVGSPPALLRVSRSLNIVSNAFLEFLRGKGVKIQLEFTEEMPKPATRLTFDFSSLAGPLFFLWVIELLFPVMLTYLVYEKQHKLRIMMKMHGLRDGPYWVIYYLYFLLLSSIYMLLFVIFGSLIGLKFFSLNDYSIQFVFFFSFINLQIVLAFLAATFFSNVKTAQVIGYLYIFGSGLMAAYLLRSFIEDSSFPRHWITVLEIIPAFSLFRGLYEFSQYSFNASQVGTSGMHWRDLNNSVNGMKDALIIIIVEWLILLPVAYYLDYALLQGSRMSHLCFFRSFLRKTPNLRRRPSLHEQDSNRFFLDMEKEDVHKEREMVEQLLVEPNTGYSIICNDLKKVYPGKDGNPNKFAVRGLSLALPNGECFGLLGPNGAGKTSFINMMIGLTTPTSGNALVRGCNILNDMDNIYNNMGVCPQNDMLWEMLTGREHLIFYGRLKNLKGSTLTLAVEESLRSVNLLHGGAADKQVKKYSGGMKRRLSVAISLIGNPKVVYMDEPSTGLDPASRNSLWNVVKHAKQDKAIILTTHSMEEAEALCDRLAIMVDGKLQCIGSPRELKARFGGIYLLTMTTSPETEREVENLVHGLSPSANKIYHLSGTLKFELPKQEVRIADVFSSVENFKRRVAVQAWGLSDATMEDVFIKVAKGAGSFDEFP
ncbi:ABC transporter A family member 8-like [Ananas comosus]|uniref:ABC transporter A family member 8-like n=1 Tax=Ananas comosus TaxID=4615 RepID=A0A6P5F1F9_ANACO|nr:ABC transporter A family member 8-like [Ananas comosus]